MYCESTNICKQNVHRLASLVFYARPPHGITSYVWGFALKTFMLVLVHVELMMWSIKAGWIVFLTLQIVFKAQLTHLHPRAFPTISPV